MKVFAYTRVSTAEQGDSGAGLSAQRAVIHQEASRRGWGPLAWVCDSGYSAKTMKRPGLIGVLNEIGKGDVLIASKVDRLSRSMLDFATLMQRAQRDGWTLLALDSPGDLSTPNGEAMASMLMVFSRMERRLIGQRTQDALAVKRKQGVRLGRPRSMPDDVVRRIKAAHAAGDSYSRIARDLTVDGVATSQGGARWYATVRGVVLAV